MICLINRIAQCSQLSKWRIESNNYEANSFPDRGVGRLTYEQREIKELRIVKKRVESGDIKKLIAAKR